MFARKRIPYIHRIMARPAEFDRDHVLDQAKELFWRQGYRTTTINDLVHATGMQPGSLYAAFKNKENLFLLVIDCYADDLRATLRQTFAAGPSALEGVRGFVDLVRRQAVDRDSWKGCLLVNSMVEFSHEEEGVIQARLRSIFGEMEQMFARQLNQARADGELDTGSDPLQLASYLQTCLWGLNAIRGSRPDHAKISAIVDLMLAPFR